MPLPMKLIPIIFFFFCHSPIIIIIIIAGTADERGTALVTKQDAASTATHQNVEIKKLIPVHEWKCRTYGMLSTNNIYKLRMLTRR